MKFNNKIIIILYSILHLCVDGICIYAIFHSLYDTEVSSQRTLWVFLIYNGLAFLLQPIIGVFIDKYKNHIIFLIISIALLGLGLVTNKIYYLAAILLGLGNAFFHVAGGHYTISSTKKDIIAMGLFVSTGAIGVGLGQLFNHEAIIITMASILVVGGILILFSQDNIKIEEEKEELIEIENEPKWNIYGLVILVLLVVFLRSLVGTLPLRGFSPSVEILLLIYVFSGLGKFLGGVLTKYLGLVKTILISGIISTVMFGLFSFNPVCFLIGILVFNFSMPIALNYAVVLIKDRPGLAFGALAAMLVLGSIPIDLITWDREMSNSFSIVIAPIFILISTLIVLLLEWRIRYVHNVSHIDHFS